MPLTTKTKRCPSCGSRNDAATDRCRICTRPLVASRNATEAVYEEALWSQRIAQKHASDRMRKPSILAPLGLGLLVLAILNYFLFGLGPDWAHAPREVPQDFSWRQFDEPTLFRVDLPGAPLRERSTTAQAWSTWVDANWSLVLGEQVLSPQARADAERDLYASQLVAWGQIPTDVLSVSATITSFRPGIHLESPVIFEVAGSTGGHQYDFDANYTDWPSTGHNGTLKARVISVGGQQYLVATLFDDAFDTALHQRLVQQFVLDKQN